jgi:hypothetical protein
MPPVICLLTGRIVTTPPDPGESPPDHTIALVALLDRGFTLDDLTTDPEHVASLDYTAPGFVSWMRRDPFARAIAETHCVKPTVAWVRADPPAAPGIRRA